MYIIIAIICLTVLATVVYQMKVKNSNEVYLTGKITAVSFEASRDGDSFITVDNKYQIKLSGGKSENADIWGEVRGINLGGDGSEYVGKNVKVYATKYVSIVDPKTNTFTSNYENDKLTISGSKKYFAEVLP